MFLKIWIEDNDGNTVQLGNCLTDSVNRALELYKSDLDKYEEEHQTAAFLCWKFVDA